MNDTETVTTEMPPEQPAKTLHDHLSEAGKKGAAAQPRKAKVEGGKAGAKSRWDNRPLCPACFKPATKAQIRAKEFVTKAQLESRKNVS